MRTAWHFRCKGAFSFLLKSLAIVAALVFLLSGCVSSQPTVPRYPKAWLQVEPGMTREQVHQMLGEPQSVQAAQSQETWRASGNWKFTVTYNGEGKVTSAMDYRSPQ